MQINKAILLGNVGKDPVVRYLENKTPVASFPLATTERYKGTNYTTWHTIVAWRQLAEIVEKYVVKGSELYIEGKITSRTYNDKDGVKRYITEIVANQIQLGRKPQENQPSEEQQSKPTEEQQSKPANESQPQEETKTANNQEPDFDVEEEPETDDLPF